MEDGALGVTDGWVSAKDVCMENAIFEFGACAPEDAPQVQIWAGFRHFSRDYRYVVSLRGGNNNHLYLVRMGAEGYDKMLALRPLEWSPMPGEWYHIRVVCAGNTIAVYLGDDEKPLLCVEDADAPFHVGSISLGGSYVSTRFKDVRVTEIADNYLEGVSHQADFLDSVAPTEKERKSIRSRERAAYRPYVVPAFPEDRMELPLDGKWLFILDYEQEKDAQLQVPGYDDSAAHVITVPSSWIPLQAWLEGESMRWILPRSRAIILLRGISLMLVIRMRRSRRNASAVNSAQTISHMAFTRITLAESGGVSI